MAAAETVRRKLDLGRVFGDTFGVIKRQAGPLFGVTFVLGYLPGLISSFFTTQMMHAGRANPAAPFAMMTQPLYWVLTPISLLLTSFLLACQLQIALGDLDGQRLPLTDILRIALRKALPILGAIVLLFLGLMGATVFFFVPAVILGITWVVALPATVADTSNPARALGRSRALTRGNRWRIFGLTLLVWFALGVLEVIALGAMGGVTAAARMPPNMLSLALISLFSFAFYVIGSVGSAALYVQLRELKGGGGESVAQVFA